MNPREYELMFQAEDTHWWYAGLRALLKEYIAQYANADSPKILDIGCGTGATLAMLGGMAAAFGVDIAPEALERCRKRELTRLARGSATALPCPDNHFDIAVMLDVLYHRQVNDRAGTLREAWRVLRPGGVLLVNVPAYAWLTSSHDTAVHTAHRFTKRELIALLCHAGFEVSFATYWNTLLFPAVAALRIWRKGCAEVKSDLAESPGPMARILCPAALRAERAMIRRFALPFGSSIFAVARKEKISTSGQGK